MGGPLCPCIYLAPLWRYGTSKIIGERPWPFGVKWRHRSRDNSIPKGRLPMGAPLRPCIYLALLGRYKASNLHLPRLKPKSSLCMLRVTLPIHYASFVRLRRWLRVVCRWASLLLSIFSRNFSKSENEPKICSFGGLERENIKDECW